MTRTRAFRAVIATATALAASGVATAAPPERSALRAAAEDLVGAEIHGTWTTRWSVRRTHDETDQDLYGLLDLHAGDESRDRVSGSVLVRAFGDLDGVRGPGSSFGSIDDTRHGAVNALLYEAFVSLRPETGPLEKLRAGRQYVYAAETFAIDGVSATTRPFASAGNLTLTAYGGIPVHFYESSASGDWIAGLRAEADPWSGGSAALDLVHERDRLSSLGSDRENDLAALSLWQDLGPDVDLFGQFQWLDGHARDATFRATAALPDDAFLVQAGYHRLFDTETRLVTELDPYTDVIHDLVAFHEADLRLSKGFGDHFDVEVGASARQVLPGESTGDFNRNTRRVYVTPSVTDLPWDGTTVSVTGESWSGDGERLQTWGIAVAHTFSRELEASAGSDYSLYAFGPLRDGERSHVRTVYARVRTSLSKTVTADVRYAWERDDEETFHVLSVALVVRF